MSVTLKEYRFFRSFSTKIENWPMRKAEALWRKMRERKIAGMYPGGCPLYTEEEILINNISTWLSIYLNKWGTTVSDQLRHVGRMEWTKLHFHHFSKCAYKIRWCIMWKHQNDYVQRTRRKRNTLERWTIAYSSVTNRVTITPKISFLNVPTKEEFPLHRWQQTNNVQRYTLIESCKIRWILHVRIIFGVFAQRVPSLLLQRGKRLIYIFLVDTFDYFFNSNSNVRVYTIQPLPLSIC